MEATKIFERKNPGGKKQRGGDDDLLVQAYVFRLLYNIFSLFLSISVLLSYFYSVNITNLIFFEVCQWKVSQPSTGHLPQLKNTSEECGILMFY